MKSPVNLFEGDYFRNMTDQQFADFYCKTLIGCHSCQFKKQKDCKNLMLKFVQSYKIKSRKITLGDYIRNLPNEKLCKWYCDTMSDCHNCQFYDEGCKTALLSKINNEPEPLF